MRLHPVKEGKLILCQLWQNLRLPVASAKLLFHLFHLRRNPLVSLMLLERLEQVKLGILFNLHAQVEKLLDRSIAGKEIQGPGTERNNLQSAQSYDSPGNGNKLMNPVRAFRRGPHRVLRDVGLHIAQLQVIACIQHTAICVAAPAHQVVLALLGSRYVHGRAVKMLCQQCL